jgi:diacylglycerol O-acyltransferase / wax synthase
MGKRRLSVLDASWLFLERRNTPMHIGGLSLYRLPDGESPQYVREVFSRHRNAGRLRAPFDRKLAWPRLNAGLPSLVEDDDVDLDYHIRHSALPGGGSYRDLFVLVSRLHSTPMDRQRPLWEFHVIEGLPKRQYATYMKVHHSLADGSAGVRMMHASLSKDPSARDMPAMWSQAADQIGRIGREHVPRLPPPIREQIATQMRTAPQLARVAAEMLRVATGRQQSPLRTPWQAPPSILNGRLSAARRVVCQSWPQTRIQSLARSLGLTFNDVILAMCGGALRAYLLSHGALPAQPLICGVPVAIESDHDHGYGNAISMVFANLGTHLADPAARLDAVRDSVRAGKSLLSSLSRESLLGYTMLATTPLAIGQIAGMASLAPPAFNLIISNVPGPKDPLYWNGAQLEHVYPVSLLPDGQALNITLLSYAGSVDFSITACRRSLPQIQRLIDHLEDAMVDLERLVQPVKASPRRPRKLSRTLRSVK